ncbi:MAG: hypothetical protein GT601_18165 [Acidaminobacter sp.]|uniref:flagellar hook assembly protein FlgD n=1 Tax=Acidaminobacter sp. TaxID=1872102 RepID=UPI001385ACBF|nr:flagellar hook capping FlgD N-terminal domain-containing protein [Acidaminobacter sp.]MZQ99597.1 hypothetical protein [Acidaminobacter sp.]
MEINRFNIFQNVASAKTQGQTQGVSDSNGFIGKYDFFNILAAQLKYQDPMAGGDNSEYIAQMSQFAMIEKLENLSDQVNTLYNLSAAQNAMNMIGKDVVLNTMEAGEVKGVVDRVEISQTGIHYVVNGESYAHPTLLSVGSAETKGAEIDSTAPESAAPESSH